MNEIATVQSETLTDGSKVWNVLCKAAMCRASIDDQDKVLTIRIGCETQDAAINLADSLNDASWIEEVRA